MRADTFVIMRGRYIVALGILGAYFIASYFVLHAAIVHQRSMERAIVTSGQQRMYSQRIAMFADAIVARPGAAARRHARADLSTSIRIFTQAHEALTSGNAAINPPGWPPDSVKRMYFAEPFGVDRQVRAYVGHAKALESRASKTIVPGDPDLEYLLSAGPGPLLQSLDAVVRTYNDEQRASTRTFEALQVLILILGLSTLASIWFTILRPLEREVAAKTAELQAVAMRDPLTGLLNRNAFHTRVEGLLERGGTSPDAGAMLMIDLDRFKQVNDSHGHLAGDRAILAVAERLRANVRAGDQVTRLGGDEFAVFAPSIDDERGLAALVDRLCSALCFELEVDGHPHLVSASIGVALYPAHAGSMDRLLAVSDRALYAAKSAGRGTFRYADDAIVTPELGGTTVRR